MDYRYYLMIGAAAILALIFIKKIWKFVLTLAVLSGVIWYFFLR